MVDKDVFAEMTRGTTVLKTNKQKGIAIGVIIAADCVYSLFDNKSFIGLALDLVTSTIPGAMIAYWLYHREEPKKP